MTLPRSDENTRTRIERAPRVVADLALSESGKLPTVRTEVLRCVADRATICDSPDGTATSELVFGEVFHEVERTSSWLRGACGHDGYSGFARACDFGVEPAAQTHRVTARIALVFAEPGMKSRLVARLPIGARLAAMGAQGDFLAVHRGFVHKRHVATLADNATDPVEAAIRLVGAPYLWGGRTGEGIDCSGMIQVALGLCGLGVPRDSIDQRMLGAEVDAAQMQRGDLVFFPGHVGIMASPTDLLHANAHWMTTLVEPLADVVERLRPFHAQPIVAVRRL